MKAGDLFIDVSSERPVVLLGDDVKTINYGTVIAHMVKILDAAGKIRTLEVKMLRSIK